MILGFVLVAVGVAALTGGTPAYIVFALMIWALMYRMFGRRNRARRYARSMASGEAPSMPPYPIIPAVPPTRSRAVEAAKPTMPPVKLPPDVEQKVDRIQRKAAVLAQHADRFPIGSHDLYVVQHTPTDYLPQTIKAFTDVPSWSVGTPAEDGRTPLQMVHDQLDMLETKLDEIAEQVKNQRVDRLLMNERFLEQNFGRREDELTIPRRQ
jgi:hypothetical protein